MLSGTEPWRKVREQRGGPQAGSGPTADAGLLGSTVALLCGAGGRVGEGRRGGSPDTGRGLARLGVLAGDSGPRPRSASFGLTVLEGRVLHWPVTRRVSVPRVARRDGGSTPHGASGPRAPHPGH